jgi:cleavage stimulation factor subunit 3
MDKSVAAQNVAGDKTRPTANIFAFLSQNDNANIKTEPESSSTTEFNALFSKLTNESPHNPDDWRRLIDLATNSGQISKIQLAYDELLKHYPNTVRVLVPQYQ